MNSQNTYQAVPNSFSISDKAVAALSPKKIGLQITGSETEGKEDGHLLVQVDGHTHQLPYEIKPLIDRRDQLVMFRARHPDTVLVTRSLSTMLAEQCLELGIQFIDTAGNCYLRQPGLYVYISGEKETLKEPSSARGLTPAALRLVFAVLARPDILNSNVRKIGEIASISHGAASAALITLEERGFLSSSNTGRRMLARPERWLDTWTEGYLGRIRPKLDKLRMSAPLPLAALIDRVNPRMREVALGGEAAAVVRGLGLKPGTLTLYVDLHDPHVLKDLVQQYKLRRDPGGPIELVSMFWNTMELENFPTVPDPLIYADLVGIGDARTMEVAEALRKEICSDVQSKA
ncbi:MAG: type IV toxin-antitoxin system AbiEi family antitoxin [Pseudomonadota bacterium]